MAKKDTTKSNPEAAPVKSGNKETIKSLAWLVEATIRGFSGWLMLAYAGRITASSTFTYVIAAAAIYLLGTAAIIVVAHFVKAHKG